MLHYGLDVHKRYTTYCVMDERGTILREGRCQNEDLPRVFLEEEGSRSAVMEAGPNWGYLYDQIEPLVDTITLAHPLRVRAIAAARVKTDAIDARTLAHLLRADLIPASYVPEPAIRRRRELLRYRMDLVKQRTAMKNRVHALLAQVGAQAPVTDVFGRKGRQWLGRVPLDSQRSYELAGYLRILDCLNEEILEVTARVRAAAGADPAARLLMTIPGIAELTAWTLLAEIGDVTRFPAARVVLGRQDEARAHHQTGSERPPLGADRGGAHRRTQARSDADSLPASSAGKESCGRDHGVRAGVAGRGLSHAHAGRSVSCRRQFLGLSDLRGRLGLTGRRLACRFVPMRTHR